jgi:thiopurine S-methyltransferase
MVDQQFWLDRWNRKQTGFHQHHVNAQLQRFWPQLGLAPEAEVFVPLCGKSGDMIWLHAQGHPIVGVELSPVAAAAFFSEHGVTPHRGRRGAFEVFESNGIRIFCGNFFDLTADDLAGVKAVYDRAALVALPPAMRGQYAAHMAELVPPGTPMLLAALEYPQAEMEGPPFSVSATVVDEVYAGLGDVRELRRDDVLAQNPRFAERGVTAFYECAYLVTLGGQRA